MLLAIPRHFALLLALGLCMHSVAHAETGAAIPAPLATSQLQDLRDTLADPARRTLLIKRVEGLIALSGNMPTAAIVAATTATATPGPPITAKTIEPGIGNQLVDTLSEQTRQLGEAALSAASFGPFYRLMDWAERTARNPQARGAWASGVAIVAGVLLLAWLTERIVHLALSRLRRRVDNMRLHRQWTCAVALVVAVLLRWMPPLTFLSMGYALLSIALAAGSAAGTDVRIVGLLVVTVLNARTLVQAVSAVLDAFLARWPIEEPSEDGRGQTLAYWLVWTVRLARFSVYGFFILGFWRAVGIDAATDVAVSRLLGLILTGLLIMLLLQNRQMVARLIHGRGAAQTTNGVRLLRARLAQSWHVIAALYLAFAYLIWAADLGGFAFLVRASILSLLVFGGTRLANLAATRGAHLLLSNTPTLHERLPGLERRVARYTYVLIGGVHRLIWIFAALLLLQIWGLNGLDWIATKTGKQIVAATFTICIITAFAAITWEVVSLIIELYMARPGTNGQPLGQSARALTLLPLFRKALAGGLCLVVGIVTLSALGVNIGPLLAGAGIVGIAVGFGAQTLVKDVITGMFILMQDAVAVGDVVTVGGSSGLVEQISVRSIRLRDQSGTVIFIPFSEVTTVKNMTKDFSYALFEVSIAYREDVSAVIKVLVSIAEEMRQEAAFASRILDPMEVLGLDRFADSAVIVKVRIKTLPIQQWDVMREFNLRMKERFDALGIEIPFPHRTIYFGTDKATVAETSGTPAIDVEHFKTLSM